MPVSSCEPTPVQNEGMGEGLEALISRDSDAGCNGHPARGAALVERGD